MSLTFHCATLTTANLGLPSNSFVVLNFPALCAQNKFALKEESQENITRYSGWGEKEVESRMVTCCPRRVRWLGGNDRHLGGAFLVRMLPVRRQSFALLHTHPGEQRFITELFWTWRAHTHTHTHWQTHTPSLMHGKPHTQERRDLQLKCC